MKILKYFIFPLTAVIISTVFSNKFNLNNNAFDIIATFLSIIIGFTITALSIIATSQFSKKLYAVESEEDNSKSLLHILVHSFKKSTVLFIGTIVLIIILKLFPESNNGIYFYLFDNHYNSLEILKTVILYFTTLSFFSFIDLFNTFSKFVIKSGSE